MKVTGYMIREALRRWSLKREAASGQFEDSLKVFEDEKKATPLEVMTDFRAADLSIALLQVVQDRYNLAVYVEVNAGAEETVRITLASAVKLVGGVGRAEKMWRSAAKPKGDGYSYGRNADVRKSDEIRARNVMDVKDLLSESEKMARYAASLRQAIALGNGQEVDSSVLVDDQKGLLDSSLFE